MHLGGAWRGRNERRGESYSWPHAEESLCDVRTTPAGFFSILLMIQFEPHSAQQMRHAKGLLEGLPCPEEFRDIQDILFPSCA